MIHTACVWQHQVGIIKKVLVAMITECSSKCADISCCAGKGLYFLLFTSPMITHMKKKDAIPSPKNACSNDAMCAVPF